VGDPGETPEGVKSDPPRGGGGAPAPLGWAALGAGAGWRAGWAAGRAGAWAVWLAAAPAGSSPVNEGHNASSVNEQAGNNSAAPMTIARYLENIILRLCL